MALKLKSSRSFRALHTDGLEEEEIREHEYQYQNTEFDEYGNTLSEETFSPEGELEHKSEYAYDNKGRLVEEILIEEDDFISEHRTSEYDEQGRLYKEQLHYLDDSFDETVYTYNAVGMLISKVTTDSEGEVGNRVDLEYKGALLLSEAEYDADGAVISKKKFSYDEVGNLTEESVEGKEEEFSLTHEYGENGKRLVSRRFDRNGKLVARSTYTYDVKGQAVEIREETVTGIELMKMEYDERGNLLLQETSTEEDEEVLSTVERTYNENDHIVTTHVYINGRGQRAMQDYRIRFEYETFGE